MKSYITYGALYLRPGEAGIVLGNEPFEWHVDPHDSSIAAGNTRWDTDGAFELDKEIILYPFRNKPNQTSFEFLPGGGILAKGHPLTIKNNTLVFGNALDKAFVLREVVEQGGPPIKFVAYNILTGHAYFENDFTVPGKVVPGKLRTWGLGREKLVRTEVLKADIAVLVECTKHQLQDILNGTDIFDARIETKLGENDGTAILFRPSRFMFVKQNVSRLTGHGGQIVLNVLLLDLQTQKLLCVTGLHLKSGDSPAMEERRKIEMTNAVRITEEFVSEFGDTIAQVVAGDLNSAAAWYRGTTAILRQNGYKNVGDEVKITYWYHQKSIYDYIFIKGDIAADDYDVDDIYEIGPNKWQGSDHLALRCNLIL